MEEIEKLPVSIAPYCESMVSRVRVWGNKVDTGFLKPEIVKE